MIFIHVASLKIALFRCVSYLPEIRKKSFNCSEHFLNLYLNKRKTIMPRTKRIRVENNSPPLDLKTKRLKQSSTRILKIKSNINAVQTTLDVTHNAKEDENEIEHLSASASTCASSASTSDKLLSIEHELCTKIHDITFQSSIAYIYNPLEYASETHAIYVRKYCNGTKKILFLGMNPGPWGMSQTGVPFGEISMVRDWLKISGQVNNPSKEHPDRKITGFQCTRSEVSGKRLWGLFQDICVNPKNFFRHAYLHNYCPLALMDARGRNITPAELKGDGQRILHDACDKSLIDIIQLLKAEVIVGIGRYAERRAQIATQMARLSVQVVFLPHPSPRAVGNENWNEKAMQKLNELELLKFFENTDIAD